VPAEGVSIENPEPSVTDAVAPHPVKLPANASIIKLLNIRIGAAPFV